MDGAHLLPSSASLLIFLLSLSIPRREYLLRCQNGGWVEGSHPVKLTQNYVCSVDGIKNVIPLKCVQQCLIRMNNACRSWIFLIIKLYIKIIVIQRIVYMFENAAPRQIITIWYSINNGIATHKVLVTIVPPCIKPGVTKVSNMNCMNRWTRK